MLDVLGGSETTSSSLSWLFLFTISDPIVQRKIHKELDAVSESEGLPSWKDAQKLPYLQATLCEVQRASGMFGVVVTDAVRDTAFASYRIPKGTTVGLNLSKLHHDEREWPEPEKFKPERFLDSDNKFVGWNKPHGFLPFGFGRRECPGQSFAKIMLFELPEGAKVPTPDLTTPSLIFRPKEFQVVAKPRSSEFLT